MCQMLKVHNGLKLFGNTSEETWWLRTTASYSHEIGLIRACHLIFQVGMLARAVTTSRPHPEVG
jgi:hypothetical protein